MVIHCWKGFVLTTPGPCILLPADYHAHILCLVFPPSEQVETCVEHIIGQISRVSSTDMDDKIR